MGQFKSQFSVTKDVDSIIHFRMGGVHTFQHLCTVMCRTEIVLNQRNYSIFQIDFNLLLSQIQHRELISAACMNHTDNRLLVWNTSLNVIIKILRCYLGCPVSCTHFFIHFSDSSALFCLLIRFASMIEENNKNLLVMVVLFSSRPTTVLLFGTTNWTPYFFLQH